MKIDTKYYRLVVETQHDPVILKAELMDLITEIETELSKTSPEPRSAPDAELSQSLKDIEPTMPIPTTGGLKTK